MGLDRMNGSDHGSDTELDLSTFRIPELREAASNVIKKASEALKQALQISGSSRGALSAQSVCRVCFVEAQATKHLFNTQQFAIICNTVGDMLSIAPRTGTWTVFAVEAMAQATKDQREFNHILNTDTGEITPSAEADEDDVDYFHDYGDDVSSLDSAIITGPTDAEPGSEEKIRTLIARIQSGTGKLWIDGDKKCLGRHEREVGDDI